MRKTCECGETFEAKRASAKYCSAKCRKRAQRRPGGTAGIEGRTHGNVVTLPGADRSGGGSLAMATLRSLTDAQRQDTELGTAALLIARRLDDVGPMESGAGMAALMKEYRATLADALKDAEAADDELDQIRNSAALKLLRGRGA